MCGNIETGKQKSKEKSLPGGTRKENLKKEVISRNKSDQTIQLKAKEEKPLENPLRSNNSQHENPNSPKILNVK